MPQTLYEFGGSGPLILLAVANGFPPGSYRPLAEQFIPRYRVVSLPPRALWPEQAALEKPPTWSTLADDLLAGLDQFDLPEVILIGHSLGGVASMMAAAQAPDRIAALCLLDPTILPSHVLQAVDQARSLEMIAQMPLVAGARRRRRTFADSQEAFAYWRDKKLFEDWPDESLWAYTESMLRPSDNGEGMTLAWPPEWEAHYYETVETQPWPLVSDLAGRPFPVLAVSGETTDTFTDESVSRMRALLPKVECRVVPGYGHLFPLAAPQITARLILDWLQQAAADG